MRSVKTYQDQVKLKLELIEKNKAGVAQIRSRVKLTEDWQRNNKFFLGLERAKANTSIVVR